MSEKIFKVGGFARKIGEPDRIEEVKSLFATGFLCTDGKFHDPEFWEPIVVQHEHEFACKECGLVSEIEHNVKLLVGEQACDPGLWFQSQTAPEAYLQQELRRLHAAIEGEE